jgi:hypothetical protein
MVALQLQDRVPVLGVLMYRILIVLSAVQFTARKKSAVRSHCAERCPLGWWWSYMDGWVQSGPWVAAPPDWNTSQLTAEHLGGGGSEGQLFNTVTPCLTHIKQVNRDGIECTINFAIGSRNEIPKL